MALESGSRLGPYEILSLIGAGGMGEVYKAKDTRLERTVAIKVLPSHLAESPERRERFEREARAVSSLNHPNICTLHDIGEQDGTHYLVMEYIDGETLADRLTKGPLPLDQALRYGIEIADALDKAHRQGVVHRDLKPGNIMLTKPGAKLLDFGLAKLKVSEPDQVGSMLSALPTEQKPLTKEGSILGTFQYMAPEQLEGKEADARTDIFAFGSVLYEMVTGRAAFEGKSHASLISAIMSSEPRPISELQPMTPAVLDHVVKRCLSKDPEDRWLAAHDLIHELKWIVEGGPEVAVSMPKASAPASLWKRALTVCMAVLITAVVTSIAVRSFIGQIPQPTKRFSINLPAIAQEIDGMMALSPDGRELVYVGIHDGLSHLFRRSMDQLDPKPIPGTETATLPFFSPDGQWVGFRADNKLKKISLAGGPPVTLCESGPRYGAYWGLDDTITFAPSGHAGLMQVSAAGGEPQPVTTPDTDQGERAHSSPEILPGGKSVLFSVWYGTVQTQRIAVQSLETGERKMLVDGGGPRYSPTGHIVFEQGGTLWAVPFDADRLDVTGTPTPLIEGVRDFALSGDGSFVYMPSAAIIHGLVWVDRSGQEEPLVAPLRDYGVLKLSPDNQHVAVGIREPDNWDIWTYSFARESLARFTFAPEEDSDPIWTPDGKRIVFSSARDGNRKLFWKNSDGTGSVERLTDGPLVQWPHSWSPDGTVLVFDEVGDPGGINIGMLSMHGERTEQHLIGTRFSERLPAISPDGRWIAYESNESGQKEVFVRPFPNVDEGKWQISTEGGAAPTWAPDGSELFYMNGQRMMATSIDTQPNFMAGKPETLFEGPYRSTTRTYDISSDGQRFLMVKETGAPSTELIVVLNWFEELKRLVPVDN